jgi:hypothetical protein
MKHSSLPAGSGIAFLILAVLAAGCTAGTPGGTTGSQVPTASSGPGGLTGNSCGFTTCHGPDLACGPNPPQVCTAVYTLGDKCRQYASCDSSGGSCRLITTPQYDSCLACIKKCGGADATEIFTCEEKC